MIGGRRIQGRAAEIKSTGGSSIASNGIGQL